LILHGDTGAGKSRCLYVLLKREFSAGHSVRVLSHDCGIEYAARYNEGPDVVRRWQDSHCTADILALDDVFKARLTDSLEQALFTMVSQRTERGLPVIVTCQDVGDTLLERMSADRGPALIRRLREFCDVVGFAQ
jgi:DNA replication protein DnaC